MRKCFGLIYLGCTNGDCIVDDCDVILNHPEEFIEQCREINERITPCDAKMFIQLSMNVGRNSGLKTPYLLPTSSNPNIITEALTIDDIHLKNDGLGKASAFHKVAML